MHFIVEKENFYRERIKNIPDDERERAGALLRCVPDRTEWEDLQQMLGNSFWSVNHMAQLYQNLFPHLLLVLYAGVAFHEYKDATFWTHFCRAIGLDSISPNCKNKLNKNFAQAAKVSKLHDIIKTAGGCSFVGTAVFFIGVPVSLWDEFLIICEWALYSKGWKNFSDDQWQAELENRFGRWKRLVKFLTENRKTATEFIQEMLEARKMLMEDAQLNLSDIRQASILRPEYFEEVPKTAEFLRSNDPESLLQRRPRLLWRDNRIAIHLPPVSEEGAVWRFGEETKPSSNVATEFLIHGKAFQEQLTIQLQSSQTTKSFRIPGLHPFGLWDEESNRFVNPNRARLPVRSYMLVSLKELKIDGKGWVKDDEEERENEPLLLKDNAQVFVTSLFPVVDRPKLKVNGHKIEFWRRESVKLRLYSGSENSSACRFLLREDCPIQIEQNPHLVLEIPEGFVEDDDDLCDREFEVLVDGKHVPGKWRFFHEYDGKETKWEYYEYLMDLPESSSAAHTLGEHIIQVRSRHVGVIPLGKEKEFRVEIIEPLEEDCWPKPAQMEKYLLWVVLSQIQKEATWENFWIAHQAVAGLAFVKVTQNDWKKLEKHGYLSRRRGRFEVLKSCMVFKPTQKNQFTAYYCGLVNRLHSVVREFPPIKMIEAKQERGFPAHLEIQWTTNYRSSIRNICQRKNIEIKQHRLWNH